MYISKLVWFQLFAKYFLKRNCAIGCGVEHPSSVLWLWENHAYLTHVELKRQTHSCVLGALSFSVCSFLERLVIWEANEGQVLHHTYFTMKDNSQEHTWIGSCPWGLSYFILDSDKTQASSPCCFSHLCFCSISLFHSLLLSDFKKSAYFLYICMQAKEGSLYWCHFSLQLLVNGIC